MVGVSGKTVYLLDLGSVGRVNAKFLHERGAQLYGWDENEKNLQNLPAYITPISPQEVDWAKIDAFLENTYLDENASIVQKVKEQKIAIWNAFDLLQQAAPEATYIAITGTNGKSTAVALVAHLLKYAGLEAVVGGYIGRPALSLPLLGKGGFYVLEVSAQQLTSIQTFRADVAVLLNVNLDHLGAQQKAQTYLQLKKKVFNNQTPEDLRVLSVDNYELEQMGIALGMAIPLRRISVTGVGADISATVDGRLLDYDATPPRFIINLNDVEKLKGLHHWQNITCAWAVVKKFISGAQFVEGLSAFKGLRHRYECVAEKGPVRFVNDSKATTGPAAARALQNTENAFWILGGEPRQGGLEACLEHLGNVQAAYLIGEATALFREELLNAGFKGTLTCCASLEEASAEAYGAAQAFVEKHHQKAVVLLSPACNSFDQFDSFEQRGHVFIKTAMQLTDTPQRVDTPLEVE